MCSEPVTEEKYTNRREIHDSTSLHKVSKSIRLSGRRWDSVCRIRKVERVQGEYNFHFAGGSGVHGEHAGLLYE